MDFDSQSYTGIFGLGEDAESGQYLIYGFHEVKEEGVGGFKDVTNGDGYFHAVTKEEYDWILEQGNAIDMAQSVEVANQIMSADVLKGMIDVAMDPGGTVEGFNAMRSIVADSAIISHNFKLGTLIDFPEEDSDELTEQQERYLAPARSTVDNMQRILEQGEIDPRVDGLYIVAEYHGTVQRMDVVGNGQNRSDVMIAAVESSEVDVEKKATIINELMQDYDDGNEVFNAHMNNMHTLAGYGYTAHTVIYRLDEMAEKLFAQDFDSGIHISDEKRIEMLEVISEVAPIQELGQSDQKAPSVEQDVTPTQQEHETVAGVAHDGGSTVSMPGQKM
ncbi:MAG: hypothetical protein ACRBDL_01820 [Alphaproteobacteria bacterium]